MAVRLNIENEFWDDPRFDKLESLFAREPGLQPYAHYLRIGAAAYLWKVAQKYATAEGSIIPEAILSSIEAYPKLIEANVIVKQANGYFVEGSRKHLGWIGLRRDGGKKGGSSKSAKKTKSLKKPRSSPEAKASLPEAYEASTEASYSSSVSISSSSSNSSSSNFPPGGDSSNAAEPDRVETHASGVVATFHRLWKLKHNGRAPLTGADLGKLKNIEKQVGTKAAVELVEAYFEVPDGWFATKAHDVTTFQSNLAKIASFAANGRTVTMTQARQAEKTHANANAFRMAAESLGGKK